MDIEKEKEKAINLLRLSYSARKANGKLLLFDDGNFERITINQVILSKYGFDSRDFWEIICPALKEEGYLKSYNDPLMSLVFQTSLKKDSTYRDLRERRSELDRSLPPWYSIGKAISNKSPDEFLESVVMLGDEKRLIKNIESQIKEIDKKLDNHEKWRKDNFHHEFIVNAKKILRSTTEMTVPIKSSAKEVERTLPKSTLSPISSEKSLKILDQQYKSFVELQEPWGFFQGLADYVKTIEDMIPTKGIVEALENQRQIAEQAYKAIDAKALKELQDAAEEITKTIQACSIQSEPITQAIKSIQDQLSGLTWSTDPLHYLDTRLFEVALGLKEIGHPEIVRSFEDEKKEIKNIYGNYTFSEAYNKVSEEKSKLEKRKQIEPWGAWEKLPLVEKAVFEPTEKGDFYAQEMDAIRKGELSDDDAVFFNIKIYKQNAQRFHRYLTLQLTKIETENRVYHPTIETKIRTPVLKPKRNDKLIKQVSFVERKATGGPVYTFYINDDTANVRSLRADSFRLKELVKIIRGGNVSFRKDLLDYINSNKDCALYCAGKYKLTQIVEKNGESFRICVGIKAEVKSETAHKKKITLRRRA